MTSISQRHFIKCPYGLAKSFLETELAVAEGGHLEWRLHVAPASSHGVDLSKDVDVVVTRAVDSMHFDQPWKVRWTPHGGGPYPSFTGDLTVRADEDWDVAALELSGSYEPPLGIVGKAFDALLGSRLAVTTAEALLTEIGDRLIRRYTAQEDAKKAALTAERN